MLSDLKRSRQLVSGCFLSALGQVTLFCGAIFRAHNLRCSHIQSEISRHRVSSVRDHTKIRKSKHESDLWSSLGDRRNRPDQPLTDAISQSSQNDKLVRSACRPQKSGCSTRCRTP
jgi:hypothetical protein